MIDTVFMVHVLIQHFDQNAMFAAKFDTASAPCKIGTRVIAKWGGSSTFYPATIESVDDGKNLKQSC